MAVVDGGQAFPLSWKETNGYGVDFSMAHSGMTLRDWFAGQALIGLCAFSIPGSHHRPEARAEEAYRQADAMLAARSKEAS